MMVGGGRDGGRWREHDAAAALGGWEGLTNSPDIFHVDIWETVPRQRLEREAFTKNYN